MHPIDLIPKHNDVLALFTCLVFIGLLVGLVRGYRAATGHRTDRVLYALSTALLMMMLVIVVELLLAGLIFIHLGGPHA